MKAILQSVRTLNGVNGVFACDREGKLLDRELPTIFDDGMVVTAGEIVSRVLAGLETAGAVGDFDLRFRDSRVVAKSFGEGALCILCDPSINVAFLNLTANVAAERIRRVLAGEEGKAEAEPDRKQKLREVVQAALGGRAAKALEILVAAEDSREDLLRAADEIEKMTRLFIDTKKASELAGMMKAIIAE